MIYTNEDIENTVSILKNIFNIDTKNKALKILLNISLSKKIHKDFELSRKNGSEYKLQTIIGDEDNLIKYKTIIETIENKTINMKEYEKLVEYHIHRGNIFINNLIKNQTNPFLFFKEFLHLDKGIIND